MDISPFYNNNSIITTPFNNNQNINERTKKYFSADLESTQESFLNLHKLLLSLQNTEYEGDTCVISLQSQKEFIQEICKATEWENFKKMSVQEKFKAFPIVGRTIYLDSMRKCDSADGITWKFFFLQTKSLPKVHAISNTQNLAPYVAYRDEKWNCILPTYRFDRSTMTEIEVNSVRQLMNHEVTSLIMGSHEFFVPDVIVIVCSSMLEYILKQVNLDGLMRRDLDLIEYAVDFYGSKKWKRYQEMSTDVSAENGTEWRKGLVTNVGIDCMKCEHVKKFVLAWFVKIRKSSDVIPVAVLKAVMIQCIVEAAGRIFASSRNSVKPLTLKRMGLQDFHRRIIGAKFNYVSMAYQSYHKKEFFKKFKLETVKIIENMSDDYIFALHGVEKNTTTRVNYVIEDLLRTFENLAVLSGLDSEFMKLTVPEECACLHYAYKWRTSIERNDVLHVDSVIGVKIKDLFGLAVDGYGNVRQRFMKDVVDFIPGEWSSFYEVVAEGCHNTLPFPVPKEYCDRMFRELGVDIEKKAKIDAKTRLPRLACAHPRCYSFMKTVKNSGELRRHLRCVEPCTVPGFHKVVSDEKYVGNVDGAIDAVLAGEMLRIPKHGGELYLEDLKMSIVPALENGAKMRAMHFVSEYLRKIVDEARSSYLNPVVSYEEFRSAVLGNKWI